jgi:hypothetical protein
MSYLSELALNSESPDLTSQAVSIVGVSDQHLASHVSLCVDVFPVLSVLLGSGPGVELLITR